MKWFQKWLARSVKQGLEYNRQEEEKNHQESRNMKMALIGAQAIIKGAPEGEDRVTFELTSAVGGRILNVRRYDPHTDSHNSVTYVIPSGEDVGNRVAKILNLELLK